MSELHPGDPLTAESRSPERDKFAGRLRRFVYGRDLFISYSHRDAVRYAQRLATQLTKLGLTCYLDAGVYSDEKVNPGNIQSGAEVTLFSPGARFLVTLPRGDQYGLRQASPQIWLLRADELLRAARGRITKKL